MEDIQKLNKVKIIPTSLPYEINLSENGRKLVKWKNQEKDSKEMGQDGGIILDNLKIYELY
jgi:hypothetical protein